MCQRSSAADDAVSAARLRLRFVSAAAEQKYWELMQLRIRWLTGGAFKFELALERADAGAQMAVEDKRSASVLRGYCRCRNSKETRLLSGLMLINFSEMQAPSEANGGGRIAGEVR